MNDDLSQLMMQRRPTAARPMYGLTVLAVEDSRFACEALRLICQNSGARLRRADCLTNARRHLSLYRPTVVMVDMGLPDGSGTELLQELDRSEQRVPVIIGMSGDPDRRSEALSAGAQVFLEKPLTSVTVVQQAVLSNLPGGQRPPGPRSVNEVEISPDTMALRDDLNRLKDMLAAPCSRKETSYAAQFLSSLAHSSGDRGLADAARMLDGIENPASGSASAALRRVSDTLTDRIAETASL